MCVKAFVPRSSVQASAIESHLLTRTFAVGDELTAADVALFAVTAPRIVAAPHAERLQKPATTRHFDYLQHQPRVVQALGRLDSPFANPTPIALDDVPVVDRSAELSKKKKKPAPADGGAAAAVATTEPAKAAASESAKPAASEPAGKAAKKDKSEKAPKAPKGGAAPPPAADAGPAKPSMIDLRVGRIVDVKKHPDADSLYVREKL